MKQNIYNNIENREPERWVTLDCDPNIKDMYFISTYGRIMNTKFKVLRPDMDKDGYLKFTLQSIKGKKLKRFSHRLVGMQFIPNPDNKPEINHIRTIRSESGKTKCFHDDNYYKNLEWSTRLENIQHSVKNNLQVITYGEESNRNKFDLETVVLICVLMEAGLGNSKILKIFGFKSYKDQNYDAFRGLIKHLRSHNSWVFVTDEFNY